MNVLLMKFEAAPPGPVPVCTWLRNFVHCMRMAMGAGPCACPCTGGPGARGPGRALAMRIAIDRDIIACAKL